jgi:CHAD domain-containing protein
MRKLLRSQTAARLKRLEREVRNVARKPEDADSIHDLRVSIRRLKQELEVFADWFEAENVKTIRRHLRKLMDRCAAVRNCDVAVEVLRTAGRQGPELVASLKKERRSAARELAHKLEHWRSTGRVREWSGQLRVSRAASKETAGEAAQRVLPAMTEELFRAGTGAARPNSTRLRMHRLRLKAKEVRYTLELFEPVFLDPALGSGTKTIMESLKGLQEKLGAINDCATTLEMIHRDRGASASVRRLAGEREAEFRTYWKEHFGSRERARWKAVLRAADGKK